MILSVSSSSWCPGSAAVCDCGTSWTFLLPVFGGSRKISYSKAVLSLWDFLFILQQCFTYKCVSFNSYVSLRYIS